jgi:hypothetical protein
MKEIIMTNLVLVALVLGFASMSLDASAQPPQRNQLMPSLPQSQLRCADFQKNPDGSWSAVRVVTVGASTISPGVSFIRGVVISRVSIAQQLDGRCMHPGR